jgi:hypothetical protein
MTARKAVCTVVAMTTRTISLTLLIPAVLGLAACGGGSNRMSPAAYKARLAALEKQDNAAHAHVDNLPHAKSVADMRSGLSAFATGEQRIGNEVAALKPPKNAEAANAELAKGARDTAAEIKTLTSRMASAKTPQDALKIIAAMGSTTKGGRELDAALAQLKKLGYAHGD